MNLVSPLPISSLLDFISSNTTELAKIRHELHQIPELGHDEYLTAAAVSELLGEPTRSSGTALMYDLGPVERGTVVLRAELDGLEISEPPHRDWSSTNGWMHACGHDIHMAALVGVVRAIRACEGELPIGVTALFQPAEEIYPSGAEALVAERDSVFVNPIAMVGVHGHPKVAEGTLAAGPGVINAAADTFSIVVTGEGGHGAYPHEAIDPVLALSAVVVSLQQVVARRLNPLSPGVVTVGTLAAGSASNVIPGQAKATGTIRALDLTTRSELHQLVAETARSTAVSYGCQAEIEIDAGMPLLENHEGLTEAFVATADDLGVAITEPFRSMGSDDFAYYASVAPSIMVFAGTPSTEGDVMLHSPHYLPDDGAIETVAMGLICGIGAAVELSRQV